VNQSGSAARQGGSGYARLGASRRWLVSDIDGTLLSGPRACDGCAELGRRLVRADAALVLASGRDLELSRAAVAALHAAGLPHPAALICCVGSEIYLGEDQRPDPAWAANIAPGWDGARVREVLAGVAGLEPQPPAAQRRFKASYFLPPTGEPPEAEPRAAPPSTYTDLPHRAAAALAGAGLAATVIASAGRYLDVLPAGASKGAAMRWLLGQVGPGPRDVVVAGDSGNDREMLLRGHGEHAGQPVTAVVVGNHDPELADLAGVAGVYFAGAPCAAGVLEGVIAHGW